MTKVSRMKYQNDNTKRHDEKESQFLNDTRKEVMFYNDIITNPWERSLLVCARKIEKIVTALYLVTDVMDSGLPLVTSLRTHAVQLLDTTYVTVTHKSITPHELSALVVRLEHLVSLVAIGKITHAISEMNAEVIQTEIHKVISIIAADARNLAHQYTSYVHPRNQISSPVAPVLAHTIFDDRGFDELEKTRKRQNDIKQTIRSVSLPVAPIKTTFEKSNENQTVSDVQTTPQKIGPSATLKKTSSVTPDANTRKSEIMAVVRSHKNATMQDIQKYVTGCSDKTLQREIASLITAGLISKTGDKRWATYHVV